MLSLVSFVDTTSLLQILPYLYDGTMFSPFWVAVAIAAIVASSLASVGFTAASIIEQNEAADAQSKAAKQKAEQDAIRSRVAGEKLAGSQRVGFAKSGVDLSDLGGTQLEVLAQTAEDAELNQLRNRFSGDFASAGIKSRAREQTLVGAAAITNTVLGAGAKIAILNAEENP